MSDVMTIMSIGIKRSNFDTISVKINERASLIGKFQCGEIEMVDSVYWGGKKSSDRIHSLADVQFLNSKRDGSIHLQQSIPFNVKVDTLGL